MMRWPLCFAYFLEFALGLGLVTEVGWADGGAVWIPPGHSEDWAVHPWNQSRIHALTDDGGRRYDAFWRWVGDHSPNEDLWQLDSIAVNPSSQRRGFGGALIQEGLARAKLDGSGAFLSTGTAHNVAIYEKYGFRVIERAYAPEGGPLIWFMRWEP
jgi:ribosomal protein S18 acetylase RimI-like enzyme